MRCQLEFHRGRDRDALAFARLPVDGMQAKILTPAGQCRIPVERPLQAVQNRRLARLVRRADDRQLPVEIATEFKLKVAEQSEILKFGAEKFHESSSSVPVSWPRCVVRNRAAALHLSLIFFWIVVAETL